MTYIDIVEVGPRDGLQNETRIFSVAERVALINALSLCGFKEIEVGSFVSPRWIPQMIHTDEVYSALQKDKSTLYSVLVPNERGMDEAERVGVQSISLFTAASEAFTQKNINCSIEESFQRFAPMIQRAAAKNIRVRGYVSTIISCPYGGGVSPEAVAHVAHRLWSLGCAEISLGDTIGTGTPETIASVIKEVSARVPVTALAIHCHDTYGRAMENIIAALDGGVRVVDAAIGGLGGCPYAGGKAAGNVATEKVVAELSRQGYQTACHPDKIDEALKVLTEIKKIT